jgi:uncharacterized alkaline shock family protein YloU
VTAVPTGSTAVGGEQVPQVPDHRPDRPASAATGLGNGRGDPADRGSLTIADRVVERVAGYAVTQVDRAMAAPRRVLGVNVGDARPTERAAVDARVHGDVATVEATIAVAWPASVRSVSDAVRQRVRADVEQITGVRVEQIDLDVVSMRVPTAARRRVQ